MPQITFNAVIGAAPHTLWPRFSVSQDFLDIQDRNSYSSTMQKQCLIKEQIWNVLIRNYFANRVLDPLNAAAEQAELGLEEMAANKSATG